MTFLPFIISFTFTRLERSSSLCLFDSIVGERGIIKENLHAGKGGEGTHTPGATIPLLQLPCVLSLLLLPANGFSSSLGGVAVQVEPFDPPHGHLPHGIHRTLHSYTLPAPQPQPKGSEGQGKGTGEKSVLFIAELLLP
jgi:hypothetical protein